MFNASCSKSESAVINNISFIFHLDTLDTCQVNKGAERESRVCRNMIKGIRNVSRFSLTSPSYLTQKSSGFINMHSLSLEATEETYHFIEFLLADVWKPSLYTASNNIIFQIIFPSKSLLVDHCL